MKKISIIIPCYNAVSCIDDCLYSIIKQTMPLQDIEIILVNDASTDDTLIKLCEWEQKYSESIMVINCEENGKQGKARDIGLEYATGQYIGFMDDDDYIEEDMYENLYNLAEKYNCDLVVCQSVKHSKNEVRRIENEIDKEGILLEICSMQERQKFLEKDINIAIWNKLYRRDLLIENKIDFPPGYIYDDIYFSALVKQYCKRVYITPKVYYHHVISDTSVSYGAKNPMERIGFIEVHMMLIEELRHRGLYHNFSKWYEDNFVIDYLTFVTNYQKSFGMLSEEIKKVIINAVLELFPNFEDIALVKMLLADERKVLYQKILKEVIENK